MPSEGRFRYKVPLWEQVMYVNNGLSSATATSVDLWPRGRDQPTMSKRIIGTAEIEYCRFLKCPMHAVNAGVPAMWEMPATKDKQNTEHDTGQREICIQK